MHLYSVVYGRKWEDVNFYNDFEEAKNDLILYTKRLDEEFLPMLRSLILKEKRYIDTNPPYSFNDQENKIELHPYYVPPKIKEKK